MFWSDARNDRIYRSFLNGTGTSTLIRTGVPNIGNLLMFPVFTFIYIFCVLCRWFSLGLD